MYHKILLIKTAADVAAQATASELNNDKIYSRIMEQISLSGDESFTESVGKEDGYGRKCSMLEEELAEELGGTSPGYYERKFKEIQLAVYRELGRKIIQPEETTVTVNFHKGLLYGDITVIITQKIKLPFGSIKLTGNAKVSDTKPAEYIRNIDLALEYAERLKKGISKKLPDFRASTIPGTSPGGY